MRKTDDAQDVMMTVRFSAAEIAKIDELIEELRDLHDPEMDRDKLLGQIHLKASGALLDGAIESEEIVVLVRELIAGGVIERRRDEIPENPTPAIVASFSAEIEAELANVGKSPDLFTRALFVMALRDWKAFGLGPFRNKWLRSVTR